MATIKSYSDFQQSKVLSKILSDDSADMRYHTISQYNQYPCDEIVYTVEFGKASGKDIPCWSLAALLNILHNKAKDIPSLSGGGYKAGKYTSDWCLDYEFENGDYQIVFADNPVDACYNMIVRLQDLNLL
jgi:hypothetical protein